MYNSDEKTSGMEWLVDFLDIRKEIVEEIGKYKEAEKFNESEWIKE